MISDSEKLEIIEKAILELQSGKRVTSVTYGDVHVQYAGSDLEQLLKLRSQIKANLKTSSKRQIVFTTSKGVE